MRIPELTPEIEQVISRYLEIQESQRQLRDEKAELQEELRAHLATASGSSWAVTVGGTHVRIWHKADTEVTYDESLLQKRLGERYRKILKPDWRKIRRRLDEVAPYLEPVLTEIGTPDRDRVREAVEDGLVSAEEFEGAFQKEKVIRIAVQRDRPSRG